MAQQAQCGPIALARGREWKKGNFGRVRRSSLIGSGHRGSRPLREGASQNALIPQCRQDKAVEIAHRKEYSRIRICSRYQSRARARLPVFLVRPDAPLFFGPARLLEVSEVRLAGRCDALLSTSRIRESCSFLVSPSSRPISLRVGIGVRMMTECAIRHYDIPAGNRGLADYSRSSTGTQCVG